MPRRTRCVIIKKHNKNNWIIKSIRFKTAYATDLPWRKSKENRMNTIDTPSNAPIDAVELGVVSTDTKGGALVGEDFGDPHVQGISDE